MVRVLASSAVYRGFEPQSTHTEDYKRIFVASLVNSVREICYDFVLGSIFSSMSYSLLRCCFQYIFFVTIFGLSYPFLHYWCIPPPPQKKKKSVQLFNLVHETHF